MNVMGWQLLRTAAALAAGLVTTRIVDAGWKAVSRREAPTDPTAVHETSWREAVLYAAVLGLSVGAARVLAERKAAEYYLKSTGHLPGEPPEES